MSNYKEDATYIRKTLEDHSRQLKTISSKLDGWKYKAGLAGFIGGILGIEIMNIALKYVKIIL